MSDQPEAPRPPLVPLGEVVSTEISYARQDINRLSAELAETAARIERANRKLADAEMLVGRMRANKAELQSRADGLQRLIKTRRHLLADLESEQA